jgi:hypothetical protein
MSTVKFVHLTVRHDSSNLFVWWHAAESSAGLIAKFRAKFCTAHDVSVATDALVVCRDEVRSVGKCDVGLF